MLKREHNRPKLQNEIEEITIAIKKDSNQEPVVYKLIKAATQAAQEPQTAPEPLQPIKSTPEEEKHVYMANTKPQKQSFSFRAEQTKIENWKLYAETVGAGDIGALWTAAIDEYIANHKLTANQKEIFAIKKQVLESEKKIKNRMRNN